jgi:thioredoxin-like negative regulator of GroEL
MARSFGLLSKIVLLTRIGNSFEPDAEKTCEELLTSALQTDPGNPEALQALASVRMSQQRPEDAKQCLEEAWSALKNLDSGISHSLSLHVRTNNATQTIPDCPQYLLASLSSNFSLNWLCTHLLWLFFMA